MTQFPKKLCLPQEIFNKRAERQREIIRSATWGILIRSSIIAFEFIGVWLFASSALLLDALASLVDIVSSFLLIIFIRLAARPPDREHPFGHGRYEPIIGLQLGLLLILIGGGMVVQQGMLLPEAMPQEIDSLAWIFPVTAMILLEISYRIVMSTAKKQNSPALAADASHYRVDALTSLYAAIALIAGAFIPAWSHLFDHLGALVIALFMVFLGFFAARKNIQQLLDRVPEPQFFQKVTIAANRVVGVLDTEKIGIQLYGPDAHVDIDIEVEPQLTVAVAHEISQKVRLEIQKEWPAVRDVTVHVEPYYPNDH